MRIFSEKNNKLDNSSIVSASPEQDFTMKYVKIADASANGRFNP